MTIRAVVPLVALASLGGLAAVTARPATARPASRGFYADVGLGATGLLGDARHDAAIGPVLALRVGEDLTSWASVGVAVSASSHEATVPPPPEGEWLQLYQARVELRLGGRAGAFAWFVDGGAGGAYVSSNLLEKVGVLDPGERGSLAVAAGAGLEYQLQNRHYALGVAAGWWLLPAFDGLQGVEGRAFLRYTYGGAH